MIQVLGGAATTCSAGGRLAQNVLERNECHESRGALSVQQHELECQCGSKDAAKNNTQSLGRGDRDCAHDARRKSGYGRDAKTNSTSFANVNLVVICSHVRR